MSTLIKPQRSQHLVKTSHAGNNNIGPSDYELQVGFGIAETLRWSLRLYFDDILFEITRLRVMPDQLELRWRLQGVKHPSLFMGRILGLYTTGPTQFYEGIFLYKFDSKGYINEHRIEHIVPPPSRRILFIHSLGGRIRAYWEEMKRRRLPELSPI
ncbi:hypothetical protein BX666DRAFT_1859388 [Dichotomocladium elegans]|nr:hypothetical protein BX666DRAFT_1859388 [Dichotomocladium elegans]